MPIALLGTGLLGAAIGERLLRSGHGLRVWNRNPERCAALVTLGAELAGDPATAVQAADLVITVLSDVLQMATIAPNESQALAAALAEQGASYLEVPVLGSRPEALAGNLQLMVGGDGAFLEQARPVLACLGGEPSHLGAVGAALTTKLALNQLIASLTHSFSLSLHLVQQAGVKVEAFMAILRNSALHAPTFDKKLARQLADDYANPNFPTAHLHKDLNLFLQAATAQHLETLGLRGLAELLGRAEAAAVAELDYSALHRLTGPAQPLPSP